MGTRRYSCCFLGWCSVVTTIWMVVVTMSSLLLLHNASSATKNDCVLSSGDETCKTSWPECVDENLTCEECELLIRQERPELQSVQIVPFDSFVTMDYRTDRVRIFCKENYVSATPTLG